MPPDTLDVFGEPVDKAKSYRLRKSTDGTTEYIPTQGPASQTIKAGTPQAFFTQREKELGHPLSAREQIAARREWVDAGDTPAEKMARAQAMASFRYNLTAPKAGDIAANTQAVPVDGTPKSYLNLGDYAAGKERSAAREAALAAGVTPLLPAQAKQVEDSAASIENSNLMLEQLRSALPESYKGRPWAALRNLTFASIQADEALASYKAWSPTAIATARAIGAMGRVTNLEINQVEKARAEATDTVGVAAEKTAILTGILNRGMKRLMERGPAAKGAETPKPDSKAVTDIQTRLKTAPPGQYKDSTNGTYWKKLPDGTIKAITKAEYDK